MSPVSRADTWDGHLYLWSNTNQVTVIEGTEDQPIEICESQQPTQGMEINYILLETANILPTFVSSPITSRRITQNSTEIPVEPKRLTYSPVALRSPHKSKLSNSSSIIILF